MGPPRAEGNLGMVADWVEKQKKEKKATKAFGEGVKQFIKTAMSPELQTYVDELVGSNLVWDVIEISIYKNWYNPDVDTKFLPIEMNPGSAVCEEGELKLGETFNLAKGKKVKITEPVIFIYIR